MNNKVLFNSIVKNLKLISFIFTALFVVYLSICLITFDRIDNAFSINTGKLYFDNVGGQSGAYLSDLLLSLFGYFAYLIPIVIIYTLRFAYFDKIIFRQRVVIFIIRIIGILFIFLSYSSFATIYFKDISLWLPQSSGGIVGIIFTEFLLSYISSFEITTLSVVIFIIGMILFSGILWNQSIFGIISKFYNTLVLTKKINKVRNINVTRNKIVKTYPSLSKIIDEI